MQFPRKKLLFSFLAFFLFGIFIFSFKLFAYTPESTHPALSEQIAEFYNISFENKLTEEQEAQLIKGSRDEDYFPRCFNHFYDPIYNEPWVGGKIDTLLGEVPSDVALIFASFLLSQEKALTSKDWAQNPEAQLKYEFYLGDHSWQKAVSEYINGDKNKAYYHLGFLFHLIEDAAVPAHTRGDTHIGFLEKERTGKSGDPYESWAHNFTETNNLQIAEELKGVEPPHFDNLDEIFDYAARYSNNYFFSQDTKTDPRYTSPNIKQEIGNFAYGIDENNISFRLAVIEWTRENKKTYTLNHNLVMSDYWSLLSRRAVLAGAGLLQLFNEEVEKIQKGEKKLPEPEKLTFKKMVPYMATSPVASGFFKLSDLPVISPLGLVLKGQRAIDFIKNSLSNIFSKLNFFKAAIAPVSESVKEILTEEESPEQKVGESEEKKIVDVKPQQPPQQLAPEIKTESKTKTETETNPNLKEIQERINELVKKINSLKQKAQELDVDVKHQHPEEEIKKEEAEEEQEEMREETKKEQPPTSFCQKISGDFPQRNKIIFNEIAWMGIDPKGLDEWIELKNISGKEIDLTGWQILDKSQQIKIVFGRELFSTKNYLLLERTNDETVPGIAADLIYTGGLNNNDEVLYLFDKNCQLQDEVLANPDWPAGNNSDKRTMERRTDLIWQTSLNPGGTAKRENSSGYAEISSGGGGGSGGSSSASTQSQPQITLSFSQNNPVDKEIEVTLSASNLKSAAYDVKISIEQGTSTLSEICPNISGVCREDDWQSSTRYATSTFSGTSFSGNFKLRIKEDKKDFPDEAVLIARIRESEKTTIYAEFSGKINIIAPEQAQNQPPLAFFTSSHHNPFAVGEEILFDGSSSTDDGQIISFLWDFGDGTSTGVTTTHFFLTSGTSTVILLVTDNQDATSSTSTLIEILPVASTETNPPNHVLITEVKTAGTSEFVELYNPTDEATSTSGWYLSYFPATLNPDGTPKYNWNNPDLNKAFPATTTIPSKSYFLIAFGGYTTTTIPIPDWKPYKANLKDDSGAIGIFSCNPASTTENQKTPQEAKSCKIDIVAWGNATTTAEGEPANLASDMTEKTLARKIATTSEGVLTYIDSDNNKNDFEIQDPTPKARNQHQFSDLDGDGIIDSYDSTTTITTTVELKAGEYKFKDLVVMQGGKLILNSSSSLTGFQGVKIVAENLFIDASSSISADGRGYPSNEGPGRGGLGRCDGGGSYGGVGGNNLATTTYGSLAEPTHLGSGGGDAQYASGGLGGGAIWFVVSQTLTLNGTTSANGTDGGVGKHPWAGIFTDYGGGGSGGSVYITTNVLTGSGLIQANGGKGGCVDAYCPAGGGGGGRIAVYYQTNNFNGNLQSYGGLYNKGGGAGTIYLKSSQTLGDLILDNGNISGADSILEETELAFNNLKILNKTKFILPESLTANEIEVRNATLEARATSTILSLGDFNLNSGSFLIGPTQIFIFLNINNDFIIQSESRLIGNFNIRAKNITIATSSSILADGKGYPHSEGLGTGTDGGRAGGGGYGGKGGDTPVASGGQIYGSTSTPTDFGSGGGDAQYASGGLGGGAIWFVVSQTLTLNGTTSANGTDGGVGKHPWAGIFTDYGGGGSGGSVYITTNVLTGSGLIQANGGKGGCVDAYCPAGGGGGGRIAVYYQSIEFTGEIQVLGGQGSNESYSGKPGTIDFANQ